MKKRFCPKCKSENIAMKIPDAWTARVGLHPGWKCKDCGLELQEFPQKEKKIKLEKKK
jgi:transposase-like protein